jgi:phosphatidylglycerophosphatase A
MIFIHKIVISFFYVGYVKYAPGTVSSLLMLIIFFFIPNNIITQFIFLFSVFLIGFCLCYYHSLKSAIKDPSFIVIDEVAGMSLSLFMVPKELYLYVLAFILFRIFDIYKPLVIDKSQKFNFGIGIMLDDLLAGLFTSIIIWILILW